MAESVLQSHSPIAGGLVAWWIIFIWLLIAVCVTPLNDLKMRLSYSLSFRILGGLQ